MLKVFIFITDNIILFAFLSPGFYTTEQHTTLRFGWLGHMPVFYNKVREEEL